MYYHVVDGVVVFDTEATVEEVRAMRKDVQS